MCFQTKGALFYKINTILMTICYRISLSLNLELLSMSVDCSYNDEDTQLILDYLAKTLQSLQGSVFITINDINKGIVLCRFGDM